MNLSKGNIIAGLFGVGGAALLYGFSREMADTSREFGQLVIDPVFFGVGVPRGDGHPVIVIPGFLASDYYLQTLRGWLARIGYSPYASGIKRNTGHLPPLIEQVVTVCELAAREHNGARSTLIGHSLGGVIARRIAQRQPELVRQVVTLGSPVARERTPLSPSIPFTAIYSRADRIVRYPRALAPDNSHNLEIEGCHVGMVFNSQVYRDLGELLNQPRPS